MVPLSSSSVVSWQSDPPKIPQLVDKQSEGRGQAVELTLETTRHYSQMSFHTVRAHSPETAMHSCLSLHHSIDHMCSPSPCPAWSSSPQRDVFERLLQQREKPSPRPVVTDLDSEWGWRKWGGSFLSLSFPPLPIVAIAYTPISSVSS